MPGSPGFHLFGAPVRDFSQEVGCVGHISAADKTNTCILNFEWSDFVGSSVTSRERPHVFLSESRMQQICPSGLMSGEWKRRMVGYSGTGNRKGQPHARPT